MIKILIKRNIAYISVPYDARFVEKIRRIGGKWQYTTKEWSFAAELTPKVREFCVASFGYTDLDTERCDVIATANHDVSTWRSSTLVVAGVQVARTYHRDDIPKLNDNITLLSGSIQETGSIKYPALACPKGTQLRIKNAVKRLVDQPLTNDWSFKII